MKRISISIILLVVMAVLLSGCGGTVAATSWPGVSASDDTVYVAYTNYVYALNPANGSLNWRYPEKADRRTFFAAPVQTDGMVIVGDYSNTLQALDAKTGAERWKFSEAKGRWIASPLVVNDMVLAPSGDHTLYALNMDGQLQWKFRTGQALWAQPVSDGERVYQASMDHQLYALNLNDGTQTWAIDMGGALIYSPILGEENVLYVATLANEVQAIDTETGSVLWKTPFEDALWAQPALHEGRLYLGDLKGHIYALDASNGQQIWTQALGEYVAITGAPTIFKDGVIFATEKDGLMAYSLDGDKLWSHPVNGKLYTGPVPSGELMYYGLTEGENGTILKALNQVGNEVWSFVPEK